MLEDIRLAFQGIWNHKLRSALTCLLYTSDAADE